jgi:uracil-DNA glycosylase
MWRSFKPPAAPCLISPTRWPFKMKQHTEILRDFYDAEGISVADFRCPHAQKCILAAGDRPLHHGAEAHIGSQYGHVIRFVVVSLDTGNESSDLGERRRIIEDLWGDEKLNPHMKGTTELMLGLFKGLIPEGESPHPYYSMINAAKCSGADGSRDMVSRELYHNCRNFSLTEIKLLEPHVIITQGNQAANVLPPMQYVDRQKLIDCSKIMQANGEAAEWLADLCNEYLRTIKLPGNDHVTLVLKLRHPSARDGSWQQFKRVALQPIVKMIRVLTSYAEENCKHPSTMGAKPI